MVRIPFDNTNGVQSFLKTNVTSFDKDAQGAKDDVSIPFGNELDITDEENERIKRGEHLVPWSRREEGSEYWAHGLDRLYQTPQQKHEMIQEDINLAVAHFRDHTLRFTVQHVINTLRGISQDGGFHVTEADAEGYEDFPQIMQARSETELLQYKAIADDIRKQREIKASRSFGANLIAGSVADPVAVATGIVGCGIANAGFKLLKVSNRLVGVGGAAVKGATGASVAAGLDMTVRSIGDETPSARDYAIGISSAGIIGGIISAAPHLWDSVSVKEKRKIIEQAKALSKELRTPEASVTNDTTVGTQSIAPAEPVSGDGTTSFITNGNYKISDAFGAQNLSFGSPDIILANSPLKKAREVVRKLSPFSFAIDENGTRVAQGATVEMLTEHAMAVDLDNFVKKTQSLFKEWLNESEKYNWCSKKFTGWASFNLFQGRAYDEFQSQFRHALYYPGEQCTPSIAKMRDFWVSSSKEITDKAVKAGVFNENFEAFKKKLESEQSQLNRQKNDYEAAVADTKAIRNYGLHVQKEIEGEIKFTDTQIAEQEARIARVDALLKDNRTTLSDVNAEIRKATALHERALSAEKVETGRNKEAARTLNVEKKVTMPYIEREVRYEQAVTQEGATLDAMKTEQGSMHSARPNLQKQNRGLSEKVNNLRSKLNELYSGVMDEIAVAMEDLPDEVRTEGSHLLENLEHLIEKFNTLERARLGKMSPSDRNLKEFPKDELLKTNSETRGLREQISKNAQEIRKLNVELPPKLARIAMDIEDQTNWLLRLQDGLSETEHILAPLEKLTRDTSARLTKSDNKLLEIAERIKSKGKIVDALTPRAVTRKKIQKALEDIKEACGEKIVELKFKKNELSKLHTSTRNSITKQRETLSKLREQALTKDQAERLEYINKRLSENKFTIEDISNIKDPIYAPRIYVKALFKTPSRFFGAKKNKEMQSRFIRALAEGYRAEGSIKSDEELYASAYKTLSKIQGERGGKRFNPRKQRGAELSREVDIPSKYIEEFLEGDPVRLYYSLVRTFEPDIALMRAFGTLNENDIIAQLEEERNARATTAKTNEEFNAIKKDFEEARDNISLIWGRIRGTQLVRYGTPEKFLHFVKTANVVTKLGKAGLTSIYNIASIQQHAGLVTFLNKAFRLKTGKILFENVDNANLWIRAIDATRNNRITDLVNGIDAGILDTFANVFMKLTLLEQIDRQCKEILGYTVLEKIIKAAQKIKVGKKLSKASREQLVQLGIADDVLTSIAEEFAKHGKVEKLGIYNANIEMWTNDGARDALVSAVRKIQNEGVLVPTAGSTPALFDNAWASTFLQFKKCLASSVSKNALPLLQDARAGKVVKVASTIAVSAGAFYLKEVASDFVSGKKNRTDEQRIESAVQNMDVLSWGGFLLELSQSFREAMKNPYYGGNRLLTQLGGPSVGAFMDSIKAASGAVTKIEGKDLTYSQRAAIRRLIPLNNLLWLSWASDMLVGEPEEKKEKQRRKKIVSYFE